MSKTNNQSPEVQSQERFQQKISESIKLETKGKYKSLRSFVLLALVVMALYLGFRYQGESVLKEAWFQVVTKALVQDGVLNTDSTTFWLGATRPELPQSLSGIYRLSEMFHQKMQVVSFYQAWGDGELHEFPRSTMDNMNKGGFIPLLTWEPWLSAFDQWKGQNPPSSLDSISSGAVEIYIRTWARQAVKYGKPFMLRLAHEPTNPLYGWAPEYGNHSQSYKKFWAYVQAIFTEEGARNVIWVWTPFGLMDHEWFPGDENIDYIGLDIFNYGTLVERGQWLDFHTLAKLQIDAYKRLKIPLFVAETSTSDAGGSKADWWKQALQGIDNGDFPELQGMVIFDIPGGETPTGLPLDWSISNNKELKTYLERKK